MHANICSGRGRRRPSNETSFSGTIPKSSVELYPGDFEAPSLSREAAAAAINRRALKVLEQEERREDGGWRTQSEGAEREGAK